MRFDLDQTIVSMINRAAHELEKQLQSSVLSYFGAIHPSYLRSFRDAVEDIQANCAFKHRICVLLRTGGGSAETAESMATILRTNFHEVNFLVPDAAMSAGTILCMSGDRIYMDYSSALGPIDPQVISSDGSVYVAAMGYLDKVEALTQQKSLSPADVIFLKGIDLGKLALFEQAKNFSIDLLKEWLVLYKFKNWTHHRTNNAGQPVTLAQKKERAREIAEALSDHKLWRSHGRALDIEKLRRLRLDIDDLHADSELHTLVRAYNDPLSAYVDRMNLEFFIHNIHLSGNHNAQRTNPIRIGLD